MTDLELPVVVFAFPLQKVNFLEQLALMELQLSHDSFSEPE